jgi:hypothetical protein
MGIMHNSVVRELGEWRVEERRSGYDWVRNHRGIHGRKYSYTLTGKYDESREQRIYEKRTNNTYRLVSVYSWTH